MDNNVIYLLVLCVLGIACGLRNETPTDSSSNMNDGSSRMSTLVKEAVSNNTALVEILNGNGGDKHTGDSNVRSLTVSALGTPSIAWNQDLNNSSGDSVPVIARTILNNIRKVVGASSVSVRNETLGHTGSIEANVTSSIRDSDAVQSDNFLQNKTFENTDYSKANETSNISDQKESLSPEGISIPLEALSRTKRQAVVQPSSRNRRRVLLLLNPARNNSRIDRTLLLGPGLMLLRNNSTPVGQIVPLRTLSPQRQIPQVRVSNQNSSISVDRIVPLRSLSPRRQVPQVRGRNRQQVISRQPAIQQIDLSNINLTKETSQNVTVPVRNELPPNVTLISGRTIRRNLTNLINNEALRNNISRLNQSVVARRQLLNALRRNRILSNLNNNSNNNNNNNMTRLAGSGTRSNVVQRPLIEPRLTLQQPVRSRRIALLLRPNETSRGVVRPVARRTLVPTARRQVVASSRNRLTSRTPQLTRRGGTIRRGTIRRRPSQTRTRTRPTRRRVVRPVDPFTRRFSAGFQRGSNLLNEPPNEEIRGFDGSVSRRDNNNFGGQDFRGGPFGAPGGIGRGFGGFGGPRGGFFGSPF